MSGPASTNGVLYHYSTFDGAQAAIRVGYLSPGHRSGRLFFTSQLFTSPDDAEERLALPRRPAGYFVVQADEVLDRTEFSTVAPNFGHDGGGVECWVTRAVRVSDTDYVQFSQASAA